MQTLEAKADRPVPKPTQERVIKVDKDISGWKAELIKRIEAIEAGMQSGL